MAEPGGYGVTKCTKLKVKYRKLTSSGTVSEKRSVNSRSAAVDGMFTFLHSEKLVFLSKCNSNLYSSADLQDDDSGTFTNDKSFPLLVPWSRSKVWLIIEAGGETSGAGKSTNGKRVDAGLCAAGHHDVRTAGSDEVESITDAMKTGGTGCGDGVVGSLEIWVISYIEEGGKLGKR